MHLSRLRPSVVVVVGVVAVAVLAGAFLAFAALTSAQQLRKQRVEAANVATVIQGELADHATDTELLNYEPLLVQENERIILVRAGHPTLSYGAVLPRHQPLVTIRQPVPGGQLTVTGLVEAAVDPPIDLVAISGAVLVIVLGVAVAANVAATRETRRRVDAAVLAAERLTAGDLSVRIGDEGPPELARLGRAFDLMAARLERVDRDQRSFLADLAHEIATPVNTLAGFAGAVLDGTIQRENAEPVIAAQTTRLSELLDELAALRALDLVQPPAREQLDLTAVLHAMASEFGEQARRQGVRLAVEGSGRALSVCTDRRLVETVLRNFLTNALRYTPPRGQVTIGARREPGRAVLYVRDTGPGIAAEHHGRIFDRFYRAEESRDRASGGSGLGLSIAKRAADALDGFLELSSSPGQGSEFRLVLLAADRTRPTADTGAAPA